MTGVLTCRWCWSYCVHSHWCCKCWVYPEDPVTGCWSCCQTCWWCPPTPSPTEERPRAQTQTDRRTNDSNRFVYSHSSYLWCLNRSVCCAHFRGDSLLLRLLHPLVRGRTAAVLQRETLHLAVYPHAPSEPLTDRQQTLSVSSVLRINVSLPHTVCIHTCMQLVNITQTDMSLEKIRSSSGLVSMQSFRQLSRKLVWWHNTSSMLDAWRRGEN